MKIETHPRDDHQMTMAVEIEPEKLEGARRQAARNIAGKVKIPGFRPGKAPYDVVRRLYGDGVITEEAVKLLVDKIYPEALKEADIESAAAGTLENIESLDPPKFVFTIPLAPTVDLGDYTSIRMAYEWVPPQDSEVENEIQNLRRMYANTETVERAVEEGDYLLVDVKGRKAKAAEDEAPLLERNSFALVARTESRESEWPFPGFGAKLIGMHPGESTEFAHKFAKDHENKELQGQNVKFEVALKTVRGVNLPALDDAFAQKSGLGQNVEELRERMRKNVYAESQAKYDDGYFEKLLDQIKAGAVTKYPPQVLEHELEYVLQDVENRLKAQDVENLETYFKMVGTNREKFIEEEARPTAQKRLERGLIMDELARAEKIEIDEKSLGEEFSNTWATLSLTDEAFARETKGGTKASREVVDGVAMQSANRLLTRRVLNRLKELATGQAEPAEAVETVEEKPKKKKSKKAEAPEAAEPASAEAEASAAEAEAQPAQESPKRTG